MLLRGSCSTGASSCTTISSSSVRKTIRRNQIGEDSPRGAEADRASPSQPFVSRGDNSGTHLWRSLLEDGGNRAQGRVVHRVRPGYGRDLGIANERNAYTITDRGTYLAMGKRVNLPILMQGDKCF